MSKNPVGVPQSEEAPKIKLKVYVASSWRNDFQQGVVKELRVVGCEVYDFKNPPHGKGGFGWSQIDGDWKQWTPERYIAALSHPLAEEGFSSDMNALRWCDVCVYVMPCGPSASMEMGWACGAGKPVCAYIPATREPDLMVKMAAKITNSMEELLCWIDSVAEAGPVEAPLNKVQEWMRRAARHWSNVDNIVEEYAEIIAEEYWKAPGAQPLHVRSDREKEIVRKLRAEHDRLRSAAESSTEGGSLYAMAAKLNAVASEIERGE